MSKTYYRMSAVLTNEPKDGKAVRPQVAVTAQILTAEEWDGMRAVSFADLPTYLANEKTRRKLEAAAQATKRAAAKEAELKKQVMG